MLPFIEVADNGTADKYNDTGRDFYALASGQLLQITPWRYLYQKYGATISRAMCLVMNERTRPIAPAANE